MTFSVVVPTVGRPSLRRLLESLAASAGPRPDAVILADDRCEAAPAPLLATGPGWTAGVLRVVPSDGRGPAAARNAGWRAAASTWVAFLDDDVEVGASWLAELADDLDVAADVAASQARIEVPLPVDRRPTDWERGTAGLAVARWITADMAYRRHVLADVGGFDERFPRAFREDADLALRVADAGYRIAAGRRVARHPVRPAPWTASITQQRGNADDALMRRLHGAQWFRRAGAVAGRRPAHLVTASVALLAAGAAITRRPRLAVPAAGAWAASTAEFAWARIAPGPRTTREVATMLVTSAAIPLVAASHWLRGTWLHRHARPWTGLGALGPAEVTRSEEIAASPAVVASFAADDVLAHEEPRR
ncbi:MAG: hypothetical protein QOE97_30 [Pseudonocardiales bacterium]|jgi:hypothetical protein|nr:hypothetical protein [Pseudonocardiales bacterium]